MNGNVSLSLIKIKYKFSYVEMVQLIEGLTLPYTKVAALNVAKLMRRKENYIIVFLNHMCNKNCKILHLGNVVDVDRCTTHHSPHNPSHIMN